MEKEKTNLQVLTNGIIKENPTLVLVLGTVLIAISFLIYFFFVGSFSKNRTTVSPLCGRNTGIMGGADQLQSKPFGLFL